MLGYLRMSPWRRGPLLLARRPEVFVALVAAAFVATLPAAAAAPFVSSARHGTSAYAHLRAVRADPADVLRDAG